MTAQAQTWLVLGASSAIARAFAAAAAEDGADIILAGRDRDDLDRTAADIAIRARRRVGVFDFDALDFKSHAGLLQRAREEAGTGTLNIFLAFGTMPAQAEIDQDAALAFSTIGSNSVGAVSVLQAAAPVLEAQQGGAVVALGSVAGDRGRIKNYVYGSAKAGLTAYLQGLRARLFRAGVTVTTVKPGLVDTAMTFGLPGMFLVASPEAVAPASHAAASPSTWRSRATSPRGGSTATSRRKPRPCVR
jgi:short-subunit dehydrogenase